jgi:hypothetical protein
MVQYNGIATKAQAPAKKPIAAVDMRHRPLRGAGLSAQPFVGVHSRKDPGVLRQPFAVRQVSTVLVFADGTFIPARCIRENPPFDGYPLREGAGAQRIATGEA